MDNRWTDGHEQRITSRVVGRYESQPNFARQRGPIEIHSQIKFEVPRWLLAQGSFLVGSTAARQLSHF